MQVTTLTSGVEVPEQRGVRSRVVAVPAHVSELMTTLDHADVDGLADGKQRVGPAQADAALLGAESANRVADQSGVNGGRHRAEHVLAVTAEHTTNHHQRMRRRESCSDVTTVSCCRVTEACR